jgi:prepilin-type N-terminal cleavage/methylation domain-containing protein
LKIFIKAHLIYRFFVRHLALFMQSLKHFTLPKFYASMHKRTSSLLSSEKIYRRSNFAQSGFSVFELMVVVLIFALIITMAFPLLTQQLMRMEQRRVHYIGMGILSQSKLSALSLRQAVVICGATSSITCNGDFNRGLLAFVDDNRNRQRDPPRKNFGF